MPLSESPWVLIAIPVLAILVGVIIAVWNRAKQVRVAYGCDVVRLETPVSHDRLKMTWEGGELNDPRYVIARISNTGPVDLSSGMFDQGRPVVLTLTGCDVMGAMSDNPAWTLDPAAGTLTYGPELLKARSADTFRVLVDGDPKLTWESHLAGVKFAKLAELPPSTANIQVARHPLIIGATFFTVLMVILLVLMIVVLFVVAIGRATGHFPSPPPVPEECRQYLFPFG